MTVHRRGDKWVAKVWTDGAWRWLGTFETRKEARAAEQAARPLRSWNLTVEDFAERWLADYTRPSKTTQRTYRYALAAFRKDFGSRRLGSIDRPEAQRWAQKVPYTTYRTVRTMYADALRDGLVSLNPFAGLRIPQPQGRRRLDVLTEAQVTELADAALEVYDEHFGPTVRGLILVAGLAGLRAGEIAGLEWGDIDLRRNRLHVMRSLSVDGLKAPKSGEPRLCVLPPPAAEALASLDRFTDEPAVFLTPRGKRFGKGAIHRYFAQVRAAFGRPKLQFHELRHAAATTMLERGLTPEDVAIQLGHRDGGGLVRRLYGHPDLDRARDRIAMAFAETPSAPVADRHYSRKTVGAAQFSPPGRNLVLRTARGDAVWVTNWQRPEYVDHEWGDCWTCTIFRNEGPLLSSDLIREAIAATAHYFDGAYPVGGFLTFINARKVRRKRDPGRCFIRAGFEHVGFTKGGLHVLRLAGAALVAIPPVPALEFQLELEAA